jgi:DNA-binding PadR family transcriptional regulator
MPKKERIPDAPISDDLLLAAIERAERHRGAPPDDLGETLAQIKRHLGLPHHGGTTRILRPKLQALQTAGLIETLRRRSKDRWLLTDTGQQRLEALRRDDKLGELPESPQHQHWREAQLAASQRIAGFRGDLRGALDEAINLLEADHETDSATWYALSERLHQAGRLLASAIHCLREWPEPDDSQPDSDDPPYRQRGRRHVRGWDSDFPF